MIIITPNHAVRKGQNAPFSYGITLHVGKWSAPAANEVAP
jgi:hypothetical protein